MSQWPMTELGDLISFRGGGTPSKDKPEYWSDDISWATVKDFKGLYLDRTKDSISEQGLKSSSANLIPAGHVIIPTRMALGKAAINTIDLAINQDLRALLPQKPLDTRYLLHAMLGLSDQIEANGSGATVKGITQEKLKKLRVPYPPLEEQKRIAKILDAADALRAKRRESLAQLDALLQSTFLDLFGDPIANPRGWRKSALSECTDNIQIGPFGSLLHKEDYVTHGVPLINPKHIVKGLIAPGDDETVSESKASELSNYRLRKDDVIMGRRGEMGRCAIVEEDHEGMLCGTGSLFIRLKPEILSPVYLSLCLSSASMRRHIEDIASGVTMANLNATKVKELRVPVPPMELQEQFENVVSKRNSQRSLLGEHLKQLEVLFTSLQQRAFSGEL